MTSVKADKDVIGGLKAWGVCLLAGLFFFYEFFQLNSFDVLNPMLSARFVLSASEVSALSSAFLLANVIGLLPAGWVLDHVSVRRVLLVALIVAISGVICLAIGGTLWLLWLGRFLTGAGNAVCFLSCVILASRWFPQRQHGFVMGLMVTLAFVGGMIAHAPFVALVSQLGWHVALGIDVLVGVILWGLMYLWICDRPAVDETRAVFVQRRSFRQVLRCPQVYLAGCYTSFLNLPIMVLGALWGMSYLEAVYHLPAMRAVQLVSLLFLGSLVGCPLLGFVSDYQQRRKPVMWFGLLGASLSFVALWSVAWQAEWQLAMMFFGLGFFTSAQVISYPLLAESVLPVYVGEATSVASIIVMGGAAFGQLFFGWLLAYAAERLGATDTAAHFQYAMGMFGVVLGLAAVVLWFLRETYCQPQRLLE